MRITGKSTGVGSSQGVSSPSKASATSAAAPVSGVSQADALQVSGGARLMAVAQAAIAQVPDVRIDKVEALRAQMDTDSYNPDGEAVADGLLREHVPVKA
ncbi:MAG TPA: flagellar biosynthesis anti-sigma factor FlgM [Holophagaceae bacterium]|nr:flagellar biosynthesis anti-sigma factor FlgM [Holophagaceae bacterium]